VVIDIGFGDAIEPGVEASYPKISRVEFLHRRIENATIGWIRNAEGASVYRSFDDHL
jgi:hypothetical protein